MKKNIFKVCHRLSFQVILLKAFGDYVTSYNLRILLTYIVTLYHIIHALKLYTRDVAIISFW